MKTLLVLLACLIAANTVNFFNKFSLPTKNGAMCLDGTPAAIYLFEPDIEKAPNKVLIMFESTLNGGWCFQENLS